MIKLIIQAVRQTILWSLVAGVMYPLVMTIFAQAAFPKQANGSLVEQDGKLIGSALLAQQFQGRITSGRGPRPAPTARGQRALRRPAAATWDRPAGPCIPTS